MAKRHQCPSEPTIRQRLVLPLLVIVFLQSAAVLLTLILAGVFDHLDSQSSRIVLGAFLLSLFLGIIFTIRVSRSFADPIINLVRQVEKQDPDQPISLSRTKIRELDELVVNLEQMSSNVATAAARLSSTIDLVGLHLASFEERPEKMTVHVSASIFDLLGQKPETGSRSQISLSRWNSLMTELLSKPDPNYRDVYIWQPAGYQKKRWLRLRLTGQTDQIAGILMDATDEVLRHRRLELERDYDALTHLLNKPAFMEQCNQAIVRQDAAEAAVMLFSDLDNLKMINDQYGHQFGDRYIQLAAGVFGQFRRHQGLAARLSGDEFAVFLTSHGEFSGKDGLRQLIKQVFAETKQQMLPVPDEKQIALKMSVGLAWYPTDAGQISELINLADFAMYQIKKVGKSGLHEFSPEEYQHNQALMESRANLDQLLESRQLECVAQPVVDVRTAEIAGYAMTMRPLHSRIRLPLEVIELARQQNRINDLERLMIELCSAWAKENLDQNVSQKIFFNALSSFISHSGSVDLSDEVLSPLRDRLVIDINGSENYNDKELHQLSDFLDSLPGQLALSQLRNENEPSDPLTIIRPDYIRLDHSIIRDIDKDAARQQMLANRVSYCANKDILVIAEGIETEAEMITAIRLGADYLQGYFLGRPQSAVAELPAAMRLQILSARRLN